MEAYININLIYEFIKKDVRTILRYPLDTLSMILRPLITIIPYILFVIAGRNDSINLVGNSVIYILIAYFYALNISGIIITHNHDLLNELQQGTYGILQLSPMTYLSLLYHKVVSRISVNLVIGNLGMIALIQFDFMEFNVGSIIIFEFAYILSSVIAFCISIILSYFTIKYEEVRVTYLVNSLLLLLAGITYPIEIYPNWLEKLAMLSPITIGLKLVKDTLNNNRSLANYKQYICLLAIYLLIFVVLSKNILAFLIKSLKENGKIKL